MSHKYARKDWYLSIGTISMTAALALFVPTSLAGMEKNLNLGIELFNSSAKTALS